MAVIGAAVRVSEGGRPTAVHPNQQNGDGTMTAAMAMPGNTADTYLAHFFGGGLTDDRYVVERFRALGCGNIVPAPAEALAAKGRRRVRRKVVSRKEAEAMRPGRTEIIICTGLKTRGGLQAWGASQPGSCATASRRADLHPMDVRPARWPRQPAGHPPFRFRYRQGVRPWPMQIPKFASNATASGSPTGPPRASKPAYAPDAAGPNPCRAARYASRATRSGIRRAAPVMPA